MKFICLNKKSRKVKKELWLNFSPLVSGIIHDYPSEEDIITINTQVEHDNVVMIENFLNYIHSEKGDFIPKIPKPMIGRFNEYLEDDFEKCFFSFFDNEGIDKIVSFCKDVDYFDIEDLFQLSCAKLADICTEVEENKFREIFELSKL